MVEEIDTELTQKFFEYAARGEVVKMQELVANGVNPNCVDAGGRNALIILADAYQPPDASVLYYSETQFNERLKAEIKTLLEMGVDPAHKDVNERDAQSACKKSKRLADAFEGAMTELAAAEASKAVGDKSHHDVTRSAGGPPKSEKKDKGVPSFGRK